MKAEIVSIAYALPEGELTNSQLAGMTTDWTAEKILAKTGIRSRRIAAQDECSSDLAVQAARKLFSEGSCKPEEIDYLLFCTQSPDYLLPTTACLLQDRLGLSTACGALDFNLGCSGYVYGLSLAKGLIESGQARTVLLLTADTYSKMLDTEDFSTRTLFGDGASATLLKGSTDPATPLPAVGPFVFGTDGRGAKNLIVKDSGFRSAETDPVPGTRCGSLFMSGPDIFSFTLQSVPTAIDALLTKAELTKQDVDLFVLHQANRFMLQHLRDKIGIPPEKFLISMEETGNTVSSTIPIALRNALDQGQVQAGQRMMLVGFGVGYSWGACLVTWRGGTT